jgi:hypothetical protein
MLDGSGIDDCDTGRKPAAVVSQVATLNFADHLSRLALQAVR